MLAETPGHMRKVTKRQFDAFCYARQPLVQARVIAEEIAWFKVFNKKLIATIIFDKTDEDYGYVILGRDSRQIFRAIEVSSTFFPTQEEAHIDLERCILKYENDGREIYPQDDEASPSNDLVIPCVTSNKLHPHFTALISNPELEAAKNLIKEIVYSYIDVDGHYIKEFQTEGFDARLWELYLYVYLHNSGFEIIREYPSPDYHVSFFGHEYFIEAVTVNPSKDLNRSDPEPPRTTSEISALKQDYMPIKFGSPLYTKLMKKYWKKSHVTGKPLIIAIHDYHMPGSMTWSGSSLHEYLYGVRTRLILDKEGKQTPSLEKINEHSWGNKVIPSNFFAQADTENISAVLFSNAATITKFNRMGKLAGLGSKNFKMIRHGLLYDPDPNAYEAIPFIIDVDSPEYEESWSDSLMMFHNPRAKYPVDKNCFPDINHVWYDDEKGFCEYCQPYHVIASVTHVIASE
jgi:hypothetical protein